jgi:predicted small lipoprotein YifL
MKKIAFIISFIFVLSGCGQTGALYLPEKASKEKNTHQVQQTQSQTLRTN